MAGRISELDLQTAAGAVLTDDIEIRDVDDPAMSPTTGTNKRFPLAELILFLQSHGVTSGLIVDDVAPTDTTVLWADTTEQGSSGASVLSGTVPPTSGDGNDGDFWINTSTWMIYGPRASAVWPAGVSLIGPGGGLDQATADARYVNVTGDEVMAGALEVQGWLTLGSGGDVTGDFSTGGDLGAAGHVYIGATPTNANDGTRKDYVDAQRDTRQPINTNLTTIAGLTATTDNVIQSVGGAWASRTPAQLKTSLALTAADVGLGNVTNNAQYYSGGTDVAVADGGTGRSTSTTAYGLIAAGTTATGAHQTISPGTSGHFLKSAGGSALAAFAAIASTDVSGLGSLATKSTIATADITNDAVDNTKLANMPANTIRGNNTGSSADPLDLTIAQVKAMLSINEITVASTAPSSPATNDLWVDTT